MGNICVPKQLPDDRQVWADINQYAKEILKHRQKTYSGCAVALGYWAWKMNT